MRAAIYARVSTQEQTVEQQVRACVKYCEVQGWTYDIYADEGVSGAKTSRPEFNKMMSGIRADTYQAIVIWKLDRLGRSTIHLLQLLEEFRNRNITIAITTGNIDTSRPEGRLFFTIIAGFAELEREYIKQRINASIETKKLKGIPMGRKPGSKDKKPRSKMGYIARYERQKHSKSWYAREREKQLAEEMARLKATPQAMQFEEIQRREEELQKMKASLGWQAKDREQHREPPQTSTGSEGK
jgi:DNA invertase Pin-like site-specific DNA recombinase